MRLNEQVNDHDFMVTSNEKGGIITDVSDTMSLPATSDRSDREKVVRISLDVKLPQFRRIEQMANECDLSKKELIMQALSVYDMILKAQREGLVAGFSDKIDDLKIVIRQFNL